MKNTRITIYRVVGRYMDGSSVEGYHLVGTDGSQVKATKERIIYMIGKGLVENMRVQASSDEMILRGKGVNLNNLPIYDVNKDAFRGDRNSQEVANTAVRPKTNSDINAMGQLELVKRIMFKTRCLGYMVVDRLGNESRLSREKVIDLGIQKLLSNATVQKYTPPGATEATLILRGVGTDLNKLPALIVDEHGKIIDPNKIDSNVTMRVIKMKRGGIIYDNQKNVKITFNPGDYIICGLNGVIRSMAETDFNGKFKMTVDATRATSDLGLSNLDKYPIELFGAEKQNLKPEQVLRWQIATVV